MDQATTDRYEYGLVLKLPDGRMYSLAWYMSKNHDTREEEIKRIYSTVSMVVERLIRDETPEQEMDRISKEYEAKLNAL